LIFKNFVKGEVDDHEKQCRRHDIFGWESDVVGWGSILGLRISPSEIHEKNIKPHFSETMRPRAKGTKNANRPSLKEWPSMCS